VVFELDDDVDEDDGEELAEELDEVCSVTGGALDVGAADEVVLSVATCSSRSGGLCSLPEALMPIPNNAATAAPRKAPTARRNGAPGWSSTRYLYRVNPIGSSQTGNNWQNPQGPKPCSKGRRPLSRGVWGVAPQNNDERPGLRVPQTQVARVSERMTGLEPATLTLAR
jgi:hypothetical protein